MEEQSPVKENPRVLKKRAKWAMIVGAAIGLVGLLLVLTQWVVYVGEWPDQRPFYFSGIGFILLFMGVISLLAGAVLSFAYGLDIEAASRQ